MVDQMDRFVGPRVPAEELKTDRSRYLIPTLLFAAAAMLLVVSIFMPYWQLTLNAPQYPGGLTVEAYLNRLEGDVGEIDGLNHYIGMRPLDEAAPFEKSISVIGVIALGLLLLAAVFVHTKWVVLLTLPALLFPVIFLVDLQWWMANFGRNLDSAAPLSSSVKPFVPPVLFEGRIAQFSTWAVPGPGLWLAMAASGLILVGLYFHRRAYKPLVDAQQPSDRPQSPSHGSGKAEA